MYAYVLVYTSLHINQYVLVHTSIYYECHVIIQYVQVHTSTDWYILVHA